MRVGKMNELFRKAWNCTGSKFTPTHCEWLLWIGQPMIYDGGLCVNRNIEEHRVSDSNKGSLLV